MALTLRYHAFFKDADGKQTELPGSPFPTLNTADQACIAYETTHAGKGGCYVSERRLNQPVAAPIPPKPPEGVDLQVTAFTPPALVVGQPATLSVTVKNAGTVDVPTGTIVGVGFLDGDVPITWVSSDAGLAKGASVTLDTATAQYHGDPWTPSASGTRTLVAFVDDLNRIPEYDEANNKKTASVTVGTSPVTPPPTPGNTLRLFTAQSLWNTVKIPAGFAGGADTRLRSLNYGVNNGPYSHPFTVSNAADPIHTIHTPDTWGWPAQTLKVNMSDTAQPAEGTDGHLCLLNADGRLVDMWIMRPAGQRTWTCQAYAMHNWQTGSGFGAPPWGPSAGVTVVGAPTIAGTITKAEVAAGVIPHALCMAFDYNDLGGVGTSGTVQVPPAIANDSGGAPGPIPQGGLLLAQGTKPADLNASETALWDAARTYGCYVVDRLDGVPMFYGDRSPEVGAAFRGDKVTAIGRALRLVKTW